MNEVFITQQMIQSHPLHDLTYIVNDVLDKVQDNTIISIEKGKYELKSKYALQRYCFISNNDSGIKNIAFYINNKKNIVIDGNGSSLSCIGRVLPFYITHSKNITVKNFTVDYKRPFMTQGEVLDSTPESVTLKIDKNEYPFILKAGMFRFIGEDYLNDFVHGMLEFDKDAKRPVSDAFDNSVRTCLPAEELEDGIVKISHNFRKQPVIGNILTIKHEQRYVPGFTIDCSQDITISNVWIKHVGAMALVAQLSKNITLDKFDVYPDPKSDRVYSANADATHFVNCYGDVIVQNCRLESMLDDVINVHGNYLEIKKVIDNKNLLVKIPHIQQAGFFNLLDNSKIAICEQETMLTEGTSEVKSFGKINDKYYKVELAEEYPFNSEKSYCIDNIDLHPRVFFRNNICGKNRARGLILTSTKEMIAENNIIDVEGSAVKVNSDMKNWFESADISNLIVRNNKITRKNYGNWGTALFDIDPGMLKQVNGKYFHGNMVIENNEITLQNDKLFYGYSFNSVTIKNNNIKLSPEFKKCTINDLVNTSNCCSCTLEGNTID